MSLVLGIDTGGTYTDGVILDISNQKIIAKAKVLTTHHNLTEGITECFQRLKCDAIKAVQMVALSTTLATNAVVEGRGGEVGLLLIGHQPIGELPVKIYEVIGGGHDVGGHPQAELDLTEVRNAIRSFYGKVEAVAISGYFSIRNPEHEQRARELVKEMLDVPVICGHELSRSLGFHERTVTAALNAKLLPTIASLIESVKEVLNKEGLSAPLMIVKGDGTLMSESLAREKPIDTLLSGPAASIFGATFLAKAKDAFVLDMGGTTTDIAVLQNGVPKVNNEGAVVGGWATRVRAAKINTYGIGGDSYLQVNKDNELLIGPQRVWPLALAASKYPHLVEELDCQLNSTNLDSFFGQPSDCYILVQQVVPVELTETEEKAVKILQQRPHTLRFLANEMQVDPFRIGLRRLVNIGIIEKASVTPTDIVIANGRYNQLNREASILGVKILAHKMKKNYQEFLELAMDAITNKISMAILNSVIGIEGNHFNINEDAGAIYFINKVLHPKDEDLLDCNFRLKLPLVAIGAPVQAYLPQVAHKLNLELTIPAYAEIANAIGAASGNVVEVVEVLIKPEYDHFIVHTPWERIKLTSYDEAVEFALTEASKKAALQIEKAGAASYGLVTNQEDIFFEERDIFIETRISVTAIGKPKWLEENLRKGDWHECKKSGSNYL
jgi:N-methylhydantoinase A/oxoprolinase/acetone carboxylase beta subunit